MIQTLYALAFAVGSQGSVADTVNECPQLAPAVQQFCAAVRTDAEHYVRSQRFQPAYRLEANPIDNLLEAAYRAKAIERTENLERPDLVRLNAFIKEQATRRALPATYIV